MRTTTVNCDRCGGLIEAAGSVLAPEAGPLRRRRSTPYDLCEGCGKAFVAWMKDEPSGPDPTLATVDVPTLCA
jgi:hypothetical protein